MMDKILVTDIQRFSFHDGPGIRTTVFLKGVPSAAHGAVIQRILNQPYRDI